MIIPFVPEPYEDEILGSWLARVKFLNGPRTWKAFIGSIGIGNQLYSAMFDKVDFTNNLDKLFKSLGTTYEDTLLNLTTLPYWLAFGVSRNCEIIPGSKYIPSPPGSSDKPIKSIRLLGTEVLRYESLRPRYCPICIRVDFKRKGAAYWHRSHQLPNVYFCHKHYCHLQTECYACGNIPSHRAGGLVPHLDAICKCGAERGKITSTAVASPKLHKLIDVSVQALNGPVIKFQRAQFLKFLESKIDIRGNSLKEHLSSHFSEASFVGDLDIETGRIKEVKNIKFRTTIRQAGPPEFCALISTLNLSAYDALKFSLSEDIPQKENNRNSKKNLHQKPTIESARQAYIKSPTKYHDGTSLYWFLMLHDREWMRKFVSDSIMVPPITLDRRVIQRHFALTNRSKFDKRQIRAWPEAIRSQLRDSEWLASLFSKGPPLSLKSKISSKLRNDRIFKLKDALATIQKSSDRPITISRRTIASAAGLSYDVAVEIIKNHKPLENSINAARKDRKRRLLLWAARQLHQEGRALNKYDIARRAGVRDGHLIVDTIAQILELVKHDHLTSLDLRAA